MSLLEDARDALDSDPPADSDAGETRQGAAVANFQRQGDVTIDGETIDLEDVETKQTGDNSTWLSGTGQYGRPRGREVVGYRQIVQTSAMQSIVNGIVDQLLGGDLVFESDDDEMDPAAEDLRDILREVLTGPHLQGESLDDLLTAAVEDMLGVGNAYWQLFSSADGGVPVAAMTALDPLTIRRNVQENGVYGDPPYWQTAGFGGGSMASMGGEDPTPLQHDDVFEFNYPKGYRSWSYYPKSAAWQVKEWVEILANSTTHHNRFYDDDEIPAGLLQVVNASDQTVDDIREKVEQASGDPRAAPVVGGEGGAQWIEMGGTAINLNIIEEQKWFYQLCLGALGIGKAEVGMIEDVNRANGEIEATRVFKRVTGPFRNQFEEAFLHIARQFDAFERMGEPFTPTLSYSDKAAQLAREERLREEYQAGTLTLEAYHRRAGTEDLASDDDRFTVEVGGETIDYGAHPQWVAKRLVTDAIEGTDPDDATDSEQSYTRASYEVGGETLDLTPPDYMVAAAQAGQQAKQDYDLSDCGTGVGDRRARQIINDEAGPETWDEIAAYLTSHFEDVQGLDGNYTDWTEDQWTDGCGTVQYALWGGTGDGRGRDKAQEYANKVARAKGEEEPY